VISGEIKRLHRQKHHQTHVTNYNTVLELLDSAMERGSFVPDFAVPWLETTASSKHD
jgi:superoxide dismutase